MKILIQGKIQGIVNSEYEGKITKKVQFLKEDEKKGLKVISVKLSEDQSISDLVKGSTVSIERKISTMKDSFDVFISQEGELKIGK